MNKWFRELVEAIDMKILLGPFSVYSEMEGNRGFTSICAIETSSITMHVWDEDSPAVMQLDVYTCSNVDLNTVFNKLQCFIPRKVEYIYIDRDQGLKVLEKAWFPAGSAAA